MAENTDFQDSLRAAISAPHAVSAWEELEKLASAADAPDDVAAAYAQALEKDVGADVATMIGNRASVFCDEWFGDQPKF
jgi:hypothetical protein